MVLTRKWGKKRQLTHPFGCCFHNLKPTSPTYAKRSVKKVTYLFFGQVFLFDMKILSKKKLRVIKLS